MSVPLFSDASEMGQKPLSISQLTMAVKNQIEPKFEDVWVVGEISNCKPWRSGHIYLTLKDNQSQLRSVIWKGVANRLRFEMEDGLEVVARGHLEVYSPRGEYSLIIEQIHPKGLGTLELAFRQLREKLQKEGPTLSDDEKLDAQKRLNSLSQDANFLNQKLTTMRNELMQLLQNEQAPKFQKVVSELMRAKGIKILLHRQSVLGFILEILLLI